VVWISLQLMIWMMQPQKPWLPSRNEGENKSIVNECL
jgi:hypothetical protein